MATPLLCSQPTLPSRFLLLVYDTPSHLAEETQNAQRTVPRAIVASYFLGSALNMGILLSYLFCINLDFYQYDPVSLAPLASPSREIAMSNLLLGGVTNGLFPTGNIFYDAFVSRFGALDGSNGALFFTFLIFIGTNYCCLLTATAAVRFIYSFARDGGFGPPVVSRFMSFVEPRTGVPVVAVSFFLLSVILFETGILGTSWYTAVVAEGAIVSNGFLVVYGIPPLLRILNRKLFKPAKDFDLGRMSIPCAVIGVGWCLFSVATSASAASALVASRRPAGDSGCCEQHCSPCCPPPSPLHARPQSRFQTSNR